MNLSSTFLIRTWFILLGIPWLQAAENPGIKMTIELGQPGLLAQQTIYVRPDRKRVEFSGASGRRLADGSTQPIYGPRLVSITRCDLGQAFELNLDTHEYTATPYPPKPFTKEEQVRRGLPATYVSDKPTLRIEVTTTDTGERKELFGHNARHVITTRKQTPLEGSVSTAQESITDGWYIESSSNSNSIDLYQRLPCDRKWPQGKRTHAYLHAGNGPIDRVEFVDVGEPETGFALQSTMTTKNTRTLPNGTAKQFDSKFVTHVSEFDERPLDPALFEIPTGFKLVDHIERNPPASAFSSQGKDFWQRVRDGVTELFR
jgi:hypothetical protein